jgi:dihydroxyacetone kinase-like protein
VTAESASLDAAGTFDAAAMVRWLAQASTLLHAARDELTELDRVRGDADHGVNIDRGFEAAAAAAAEPGLDSPRAVLREAAKALGRTTGGTSGPLWAAALRRLGTGLGEEAVVPWPRFGGAFVAAAEELAELGDAREGDNTMVDVLLPVGRELRDRLESGTPVREVLELAGRAADDRARATADLPARKGRASYLGDRVLGSADPGAVSAAIVVRALAAGA